MSVRRLQTDLLLQAGRLLLEYNESTGAIHRSLTATARALTDQACHVTVAYRGVTVSLAGEAAVPESVKELRYNMAVQARVHKILEEVRQGRLDVSAALICLGGVEADTPRHSRWLAALILSKLPPQAWRVCWGRTWAARQWLAWPRGWAYLLARSWAAAISTCWRCH